MQLFPSQAVITVPYAPMVDTVDEGADTNGLFANVDYLMAWTDRFTFMNEVMGLSQTQGGTNGVWLQQLPFQYPDSPNLWAMSVRSRGEGPIKTGNTTVSYNKAIVSVNFRKPPISFQQSDDPQGYNSFAATAQESQYLFWASQEISGSTEYLPIPGSNMKWASDNAAIGQPMTRKVQHMVLTVTYERFPVLPFNVLQSYVDTLNYNTFLNCPPGTVQFAPVQTRREPNPDGTICQKLALTFKYRTRDWNQLLRPGSTATGWDTPIDTVLGKRMFKYADFLQLLQWSPATLNDLPGT